MKLLVSQTAEFDRAKGQNVMESLIQKYPNFDAVFGANDEMIIGAVEALAAAGIKNKVTIGFDATPDAFQYMKEGKLGATIDQFPGKSGGRGPQVPGRLRQVEEEAGQEAVTTSTRSR